MTLRDAITRALVENNCDEWMRDDEQLAGVMEQAVRDYIQSREDDRIRAIHGATGSQGGPPLEVWEQVRFELRAADAILWDNAP